MRRQIRETTVTLKHVQTIRRGDSVYRYLRIPGQPRIKLPDLPIDHPMFLAAYVAAMQEAPKTVRNPAGTIAAAVEGYLRSDVHAGHSDGYRRIVQRHAEAIRQSADDALIRHLKPEHIQDDLRSLSPIQGRDRMKAWRLICAHALDRNLIRSDPSEGVRRPAPPKHVGHPAWTAAQIETFRERWSIGTRQRACMELVYWTGARIGDAVKLGAGMIGRDGVLSFRQEKTGDFAHVPWTCSLPPHIAHQCADRDMMHAALDAISSGHMTFLATRNGRTRSSKAMGHLIAAAAADAGFDRSAHGLRKSRAVALAEGGANPLQIGAWTGHHSLSEVAHYTEEADRKRAVMGTERVQNIVNTPKPSVKTTASD